MTVRLGSTLRARTARLDVRERLRHRDTELAQPLRALDRSGAGLSCAWLSAEACAQFRELVGARLRRGFAEETSEREQCHEAGVAQSTFTKHDFGAWGCFGSGGMTLSEPSTVMRGTERLAEIG